LQEQPPGLGVSCDQGEHGLTRVVHQCVGRQSPGEQIESGLRLLQPAFAETLPVQGISFEQVVLEHGVGPLPEADPARGFDPVSDGNDNIEIVMFCLVFFSICRSMCKKCTYCLLVQLSVLENVADMSGDDGPFPAKQLRHLGLGQPYGLAAQRDLNRIGRSGVFVDDDFCHVLGSIGKF
jgi:hypothetical protein